MTDWVCSSCGGRNTKASAARPSLDDRYAMGYCVTCAPEPVPVKIVDTAARTVEIQTKKIKPAQTVALVSAAVWDPIALEARRQRDEDAAFLEKVRTGRLQRNKPEHRERIRALLDRFEAERAARHLNG